MALDPEALVEELTGDVLDSFEKLEVVVRLCAKAATLDELVGLLAVERTLLVEAVESLVADGVLVRRGDALAVADDGRWGGHCRALASLHGSDRMKVVTMMSQAALARLRTKAARAFSDAFVLRPKKGGRDG